MQQMGVEDDCQRSSMESDGRMQQEIDAEGHRRMQIYYLKMQHDDDQASGLEKFFIQALPERGPRKKKKKEEEEEEEEEGRRRRRQADGCFC